MGISRRLDLVLCEERGIPPWAKPWMLIADDFYGGSADKIETHPGGARLDTTYDLRKREVRLTYWYGTISGAVQIHAKTNGKTVINGFYTAGMEERFKEDLWKT